MRGLWIIGEYWILDTCQKYSTIAIQPTAILPHFAKYLLLGTFTINDNYFLHEQTKHAQPV
jgi:hypothetical protein